ncbi:MAG TPA: hypothetical protein GX708_23295 [Gallicola sp.]|nr:hypothetical protein [Gallicola sp.]
MKIITIQNNDLIKINDYEFISNIELPDNIKYIKLNDIFDVNYEIDKSHLHINLIEMKDIIELHKDFWYISIFHLTDETN